MNKKRRRVRSYPTYEHPLIFGGLLYRNIAIIPSEQDEGAWRTVRKFVFNSERAVCIKADSLIGMKRSINLYLAQGGTVE